MRRAILLLITGFIFNLSFADKLVMINYNGMNELKNYYSTNIRIHYTCNDFLVATVPDEYSGDFILLDENPWQENNSYFIAWFHKGIKDQYPDQVEEIADVLSESNDYLFLRSHDNQNIHPPVDGRVVHIRNKEIKLPSQSFNYNKGSLLLDPVIEEMIENVDTNIFLNNLQHLQDFGTRNAYTPESVEAQNWIKEQYENMGYEVSLFDFPMPSGPASDNVIAKKTGTKYPDEYVVIGGHYDSYSYSGDAPGADDDGTGTCGVMEVARVMAAHDFDRTILFCAWSGEEYGLYGSEAYASWAAGQGMNILGYFNIDMCGYRHPGDEIHTDMIAPSSAQPLVDFYTDVCAMYLPDFIVEPGNLTGGDSDHTSFNENGYMGIFPFEDSQNYSPYIHTSNDIIGLSANSLEMCMLFTQAMVANVATMSNWLAPPQNLVGIGGDGQVELSWDQVLDIDYYNIYKNNNPTPIANTTEPYFLDLDVENFTTYTYYVTAIYTEGGEESSPSNGVTVTPVPPMALPFMDDFETGGSYWNYEGSWGLTTSQSYSPSHSLTESPNGNYGNSLNISAGLNQFSLVNANLAELSFWTKYELETNYDYTYLEISTNGSDWTTLETFNGNQNSWIKKTYDLENYLGETYVVVRFRFESDSYVTNDGMYIDDFEVYTEGTGTGLGENENLEFSVYPNPFNSITRIDFINPVAGNVLINIYNTTGQIVEVIHDGLLGAGNQSFDFDARNLPVGIYYCKLKTEKNTEVTQLILSK
ncbi:MAG: M20/M25/M40 family metallo-hydrolase [Bacteroidales bacterium]|nr:M20/M25/M40 family metallo-hydrolase [Bacteroidales bacterium]